MSKATAWIRSARFDSAFILAPAFVISAVVILNPSVFRNGGDIPLWGWVVFVLLIDVAHVYGTLFKTYFDRRARQEREVLLIAIPLLCWLVGVALYSWSGEIFWRVLAYIAVFHFIRQQYGFVRIYSRTENLSAIERGVQAAAVYAATLYPLIYWHTHLPRAFSWFTEADFVALPPIFERVAFFTYVAVFGVYFAMELRRSRSGALNWPRNAMIVGTALSWFLGIVVYNSDFSFTATNVVAHGLPYMALTWTSWEKSWTHGRARQWAWVVVFVFTLIGFAYFEEWLWDGLVWSERPAVFCAWWPTAIEDPSTLAWLVPLLALPQSTHYVLDGFIWRRGRGYAIR